MGQKVYYDFQILSNAQFKFKISNAKKTKQDVPELLNRNNVRKISTDLLSLLTCYTYF
jgi:hypothetical protein